MRRLLHIVFLFIPALLMAQATGRVTGTVRTETGRPLPNVQIQAGRYGTVSDAKGQYTLTLPQGQYALTFSYLGRETKTLSVNVVAGRVVRQNIVLALSAENIRPVEITGRTRQEREGAVQLQLRDIQVAPTPTPSLKGILISLPSVSQLDEMSSQYLVRGGNYDENAVYINGIEVFRPFLIRSGRQEGLSTTDPALVRSLYFYAGGFPVELGDRLSSVLDIRYVEPKEKQTKIQAGFTGINLALLRPGKRLNFIGSIRYLNNTLLVRKTEGDAEFQPAFADMQTLLRWHPDKRWMHQWFTRIGVNRFRFVPFTKVTNFGTFTDARSLVIRYQGNEKDAFDNQFTAIKSEYAPGQNDRISFTGSFYHSAEREHFDLLASYFLGEPNTDLSGDHYGDPMNLQSLGAELDHARNLLDAVIAQSEVRWSHKGKSIERSVGIMYRYDNVRDRIREYQMIDSAGFVILPPQSEFHPDEPYTSDTLPILPFQNARADYLTMRHQWGVFASWRKRITSGPWRVDARWGLRVQAGIVSERFTHATGRYLAWSPRVGAYVRNKHWPGHAFRIGTGVYMQPPSYREYRDRQARFRAGILPQKAFNISLGHEWDFDWADKPFKLTSEVYYRYLWDINPYTIQNLRIRYYGQNNATGYAYGIETRLFGQLLPGTDSWLSLALMRTEQNIDGRGYIPRPTDQRFKMALFFRDYVPGMPYFKMYLNNVFFTGLPTGAPLYADPYRFQFRTRNYWRTDIGLFYVLSDRLHKPDWLARFSDFSVGLEIINMFDRRNSVSNLWVREIYTKRMFGVPNYLTGRIFNLKVRMNF